MDFKRIEREKGILFEQIEPPLIIVYTEENKYEIVVVDRKKSEIAVQSKVFLQFLGTDKIRGYFLGTILGQKINAGWLGLDMKLAIDLKNKPTKRYIDPAPISSIQFIDDQERANKIIKETR